MKFSAPQTVAAVICVFVLSGCASSEQMHTQTVPNQAYRDALQWTAPSNFELPAPDSPEESAMLGRVRSLFENYSRQNLSENVTKVYAEKVYFRDAFKQFDSSEAIREYLVAGMEPLAGAEFVLQRIVRSGDDEFYIDWLMRLDFKSTPPETWEESIGMTHMRFNGEGRVIFHQDYWDPTDIVYRRIPIAKQLIAFVKKKM